MWVSAFYFPDKKKGKKILVVKFKSYTRMSMLLHLNPEIV
jgi:hypothetical protein